MAICDNLGLNSWIHQVVFRDFQNGVLNYAEDLALAGQLIAKIAELLNGEDGLIICQNNGKYMVDAAIAADSDEDSWAAVAPTLNLALCQFLKLAYEELRQNEAMNRISVKTDFLDRSKLKLGASNDKSR